MIACQSRKPKQEHQQIIDSSKAEQPITANKLLSEFEMFCNHEQIEYCVPIPLNQYTEDTKSEYERAQHVFQNKADKKYDITVQGLFREDMNASLEYYFKNTYTTEDEEHGKIIQDKHIVKATNCFYVKGYYSNFELDSRFIEITWLRKDDVVKYVATYPIKDTTIWNKYLESIISYDSNVR